jgi:hypothetical protein
MVLKYKSVQQGSLKVFSDGTVGTWNVRIGDKGVTWQGLYTGPLVLEEGYLDSICHSLLGVSSIDLAKQVQKKLLPTSYEGKQSLFLHSPSFTSGFFEKDVEKLQEQNHPFDFASCIETRALSLAKVGDLAVGRTHPWKIAADVYGVEKIDVETVEHYYLSHSLLLLALNYTEGYEGSCLFQIIRAVRLNPKIVVRLYSCDYEMQIFLLWLCKIAGVNQLAIEGNGVEVSNHWNAKAPLYPKVLDALSLNISTRDPFQILELETKSTDFYSILGLKLPRLPGYVIEVEAEVSPYEQLEIAAKLLQNRYGLTHGCLKASKGASGSRIVPNLKLSDTENLKQVLRSLLNLSKENFILEVFFNYKEVVCGDYSFAVSPSAHIRRDNVAPGLTLQLMDKTTWEGNLLVSANHCEDFGISITNYHMIQSIMESFKKAFDKKTTDDFSYKLVIGGLDFAIGTIGGLFGSDTFLAVQDLNLRFNGCEFMRNAQEVATEEQPFVVTKLVKPTKNTNLSSFKKLLFKLKENGYYCDIMAAIPEKWGLLVVFGKSPRDCLSNLYEVINYLETKGYIK